MRKRQREMDGDVYQLLAPAAEALAHRDPLAAKLLYRQLIDFSLDRGRTGRYGHAARHLQDCASLASAVADWEGHPTHQAYVDRLKERHRYKKASGGRLRECSSRMPVSREVDQARWRPGGALTACGLTCESVRDFSRRRYLIGSPSR